jgi:hypothetical protein
MAVGQESGEPCPSTKVTPHFFALDWKRRIINDETWSTVRSPLVSCPSSEWEDNYQLSGQKFASHLSPVCLAAAAAAAEDKTPSGEQ